MFLRSAPCFRALLVPLLLTIAALPRPAGAQSPPTDTLARIRATQTITVGVREASRPFSFLNAQKQPAGYTVELCQHVVEQLKRELRLSELTVKYLPVSGPERIPKLLAGEIDLECGSTTHTKAREAQVDFSYTVFVAAMRVLTRKDVVIQRVSDLNGLRVALSKGTTSEKLFTQLGQSEGALQLQQSGSNDEAYQALKAGTVRAFPQDDALLLGLVANDKSAASFGVSSLALSVEPYAIMVRKGDGGLLSVVDRSLARLYASGEINAIYARWFATDALNLPMGRLTRDGFLRPNKEAGVAMVLGYSI